MQRRRAPTFEGKPCWKCGGTRRFVEKRERCVSCRKEQSAAHFAKHRERLLAQSAAYRVTHVEETRAMKADWVKRNAKRKQASDAAWKAANRDQARADFRRWYLEHREAVLAKGSTYQKAHPEAHAVVVHTRRARLAGAPGIHTAAEWAERLAEFGWRCAYCGASATTRDHVTPLQSGGSNDIANIVPACKRCNNSKKNTPMLVWLLKRSVREQRTQL